MADWRKIGQDKAQSVLDLIPSEWRLPSVPFIEEQRDITGPYIQQFFNDQEIHITESEAIEIIQKCSSDEWSAVQSTKTFCHRAAVAHQLLNCLHEIFFDAALQQAEELDKYFQTRGQWDYNVGCPFL